MNISVLIGILLYYRHLYTLVNKWRLLYLIDEMKYNEFVWQSSITGEMAMDKAIEQSAPGLAYSEIRRLIILKELKPGQRLSENALSRKIGVSRTPVREALRRLATEGWLTLVPDTGVWVASPTRREILNAYEFRSKLETWGVEMAMPNITPLVITKLEDCIEEEEAIYKA